MIVVREKPSESPHDARRSEALVLGNLVERKPVLYGHRRRNKHGLKFQRKE
jgi:hypothetical protein